MPEASVRSEFSGGIVHRIRIHAMPESILVPMFTSTSKIEAANDIKHKDSYEHSREYHLEPSVGTQQLDMHSFCISHSSAKGQRLIWLQRVKSSPAATDLKCRFDQFSDPSSSNSHHYLKVHNFSTCSSTNWTHLRLLKS
jgi:hypothetical protein